MNELIFTCSEAEYELYSTLNRYFEVEILNNDSNNGEMGMLDALKVLVGASCEISIADFP